MYKLASKNKDIKEKSTNKVTTGMYIAGGSAVPFTAVHYGVEVPPEMMAEFDRLSNASKLNPAEFSEVYADAGHNLLNGWLNVLGKNLSGYDFIKELRSGNTGKLLTKLNLHRAEWDEFAKAHYDAFKAGKQDALKRMLYETFDGNLPVSSITDSPIVADALKNRFSVFAKNYTKIPKTIKALGALKTVAGLGILSGIGLMAKGILDKSLTPTNKTASIINKIASTAMTRYLAKNPEKADTILRAMKDGKIDTKELTLKQLGAGGSQRAELVLVPELNGLAVRKHFPQVIPTLNSRSKSNELLQELSKPKYTEFSRYLGGRGDYKDLGKIFRYADRGQRPLRYFEYVPGPVQKEFPRSLGKAVEKASAKERNLIKIIRKLKKDNKNHPLIPELNRKIDIARADKEAKEQLLRREAHSFGTSATIPPKLQQQIAEMEHAIGGELSDYKRPTNIINGKLIDVDPKNNFTHAIYPGTNMSEVIFGSNVLKRPISRELIKVTPPSSFMDMRNTLVDRAAHTNRILHNVALASALALGGYAAYSAYKHNKKKTKQYTNNKKGVSND